MVDAVNHLSEESNAALAKLMANHLGRTFPAASICALHYGEPLIDSWWQADPLPSGHPAVTTDTLYDLASLTKLFTTTTFLAFVASGNVALDDPVSTVIPEFSAESPRVIGIGQDPHTEEPVAFAPVLIGTAIDPDKVTFRHLLTHTSGLAPWSNLFRLFPLDDPRRPPERYATAVNEICQLPLVDRVGACVHYSDLGFILLGEAVSRMRGAPLNTAISECLTGVLTMESIQFNPLDHGIPASAIMPTEDDQRWRSYRCHGIVHDENAFAFGGISGHAGLFGNAFDVASLGQAWLDRTSALGFLSDLADEAISENFTDGDARRGLGWMLKSKSDPICGDCFSESSYGHTGFTGTSLWIDPERELVVACLTNRVYYGRDPSGIAAFRPALHTILAEEADRR